MADPIPVSSRRSASFWALLLTASAPTLGVLLTMYAFPDAAWAKVVFFTLKLWVFAAPILWLIYIQKTRPRLPRWSNRGMLAGHATGAAIFVCIVLGYLLIGRAWIDLGPMRERIAQMNLDNPWLYLLGATYWCTVNSLLEEYFWRWFTFERLSDLMRPRLAAVGAGLLFTVHHIFALHIYFGWDVVILASLGVFVGGVTWSLLYAIYRNIYVAYVSHVWADLAVFGIGYVLIFG